MDGLDLYREEKYEYVILTWPVTEIWHKGVQPLAGRGSKFSNQWPTHTHHFSGLPSNRIPSLSFTKLMLSLFNYYYFLFTIYHYTTLHDTLLSHILKYPYTIPSSSHHSSHQATHHLLSLSLSKWTGHSQYNFWEIYSWSLYLFKFLMIYMYDLSKTVSFWEVLWLRNQKKKKERRQHEEEH